MSTPVIGIDLGTTYSCVAVFINDRVEILENEHGKRTTPSCVSYTDRGILVGDEAEMEIPLNPSNTIYDAKRLIGRRINDETVQQDIKLWPFEVVNENRIKIKVLYNGKTQTIFPEQVSSQILRKMKTIAENKLDRPVEKAVITVPAYFTDAQRQATKDAGTIAGLNVLRIINEPTAAAIAYGLNESRESMNILIYDLGGGTFDVTIFEMNSGVFDVKSTAGDTHLGGQDFTNNLVNYCVEEVKKQGNITLEINALKSMLKKHCDDVKIALSTSSLSRVMFYFNGKSYDIPISRACFEAINDKLFQETLNFVTKALDDANMNKDEIDEIVLVGGSSRIPKIRTILQRYFQGKELNFTVNPEECVACGAAIQAALSSGYESHVLKNIVLIDVVPYSLGIEVLGGLMQVFVPRNTSIPFRHTITFPTSEPDQQACSINIYEGERPHIKDNNKLDGFILQDLPPGPKGSVSMMVTFDVNVDGILKVSAKEQSGNAENSITVKNEAGRLSPQDIERLVQEAEVQRNEDKKHIELIMEKNKLEEYCLQIKSDLKYEKLKVTTQSKNTLLIKCSETLDWLKDNQNLNIAAYKEKYIEMENFITLYCQPLTA